MKLTFFTISWRTTFMDKSTLRCIRSSYQNRNPSKMFPWGQSLVIILSLKIWRNCLWWSQSLTKTQDQDYSQQPKTLVNSITVVLIRVFWGSFWNSCTEIYSKTYAVEVPLDKIARMHSTAYYRTKTFTTDFFSWSAQKPLQNYPFFSNVTRLQSRISDFSKKLLTPRKLFPLTVSWNSLPVTKFTTKRSVMKSFH